MANERVFNNPEAAAAHVKVDGLVVLIAATSAVILWALLLLSACLLYIHNILEIPLLSQSLQALTLLGLAPLAIAGFSYRLLLLVYTFFLNEYVRKHFLG
jgi:hypothetical protein